MTVKPIPDGFHTVTPYLVVEDVPRLIDFLKEAFEAVEVERTHQPDGSVMHAEVRIGDSMVMMGQARGEWKAAPVSLYLYVPDVDRVYQQALAAGAESMMEPQDQFYGDRNGGVKDPQGNTWWIGTRLENLSPEEIQRRAADYRPQG